jgi:hypothetical protein
VGFMHTSEEHPHEGFNPILKDGGHAGLRPRNGQFSDWQRKVIANKDLYKIRKIVIFTASATDSFVTKI